MAVHVDIVYQGELRCVAKHGPSSGEITTDAPVDNHGRGEAFSPTDLVAAALGSCMVTIMGIVAERGKLDIAGTQVHVEKHMQQQPVRRIGELTVRIAIPKEKGARLTSEDRLKLETAAKTCPVHKSLHPDIQIPLEFVYDA